MYQPGYKAGRGAIPPEEQQQQQDPDEAVEVVTVNLLEMHRLHCPWQSGKSQQATGLLTGLNACQVLQKVVSGYAREERRKSQAYGRTGEDGVGVDGDDDDDDDGGKDDGASVDAVKLSPEEVERLDREREGKLRRLKRMFTIKRSSKSLGG